MNEISVFYGHRLIGHDFKSYGVIYLKLTSHINGSIVFQNFRAEYRILRILCSSNKMMLTPRF